MNVYMVLKLRKKIWKDTNWEFTVGSREQSGEDCGGLCFDDNVLIIQRYSATWLIKLIFKCSNVIKTKMLAPEG